MGYLNTLDHTCLSACSGWFPELASANGVLTDCLMDGWIVRRLRGASAVTHFSAQAAQTVRVRLCEKVARATVNSKTAMIWRTLPPSCFWSPGRLMGASWVPLGLSWRPPGTLLEASWESPG